MASIMDTVDYTTNYTEQDIQANKAMGILSYIGILVLVPILAAKESPFARFHANQGLILFLAGIATMVIGWIPFIGAILSGLMGLAALVLSIIGIVNAAQGKAVELPVIGKWRLIK